MNISKQNSEINTKSKIFQVSAKLFAEKGYNGVSMREISENSGVTKPTIYYYFENKESIYKSLVEKSLYDAVQVLETITRLNLSAKQKLIELTKLRFRQTLKHPEFSKFFSSLLFTAEQLPFLEQYNLLVEKHKTYFMNIIEEGINSKEFGASARPQLAVEIIGGVIFNYVIQQLKSEKKILTDQLAEDIIELIFKGLNE